MDTHALYIDGAFVASSSPHLRDVIDPANGTVIARVPDADTKDVDAAVRAARAAFDDGPWKTLSARDRGRLLLELARAIRDRAGVLSELETVNSGKPIAEAEDDVSGGGGVLRVLRRACHQAAGRRAVGARRRPHADAS